MYKIVIQHAESEVIIHNVRQEDLDFWQELLEESSQACRVEIVDIGAASHQVA